MTIEDLNKKAEQLFKQYSKEQSFFCIDDGNFWFTKDKLSAKQYSIKLHKELIEIKKSDINEVKEESINIDIKPEVELKSETIESVKKESKKSKKIKHND